VILAFSSRCYLKYARRYPKEIAMFKPALAASLVLVAGAAALTEVLAAYAQAV
jgi:hypothetical protein